MYKTIGQKELLPFLRESFSKTDFKESDKKQVAKITIDLSDEMIDFDTILKCVVSDSQLDYAQNMAVREYKTHYFDQDLSIKLLNHYHKIKKEPVSVPLQLELFIEILGIDIPDNTKDEVELELFIHTYTTKEELFNLLTATNICEPSESEDWISVWSNKCYHYPKTNQEISYLDRIMDVELEGYYKKEIKEVHYNLQFNESEQISRSKRVVYTIKNNLNLSKFPFDVSDVKLEFACGSNFDISEVKFLPEVEEEVKKESVFINDTYFLRGFNVLSKHTFPECVGYYQSADYYSQNLALINLSLFRDANSFIIRTFIPSLLIAVIATFATFIYLFDASLRESILTTVIPSILLAEIIQHSAIYNHVPTRSGRTLIDLFFFEVYIALSFFFAALALTEQISWYITFLTLGSAVLVHNLMKISRDIIRYNQSKRRAK